ncbi:MAG: hypothetical protein QXH67_04390 [Candidatus Bathyarchaeia archaeon]
MFFVANYVGHNSLNFSQEPLNKTIVIDGLPDDWEGSHPILLDIKGDTLYAKDDGSDIKALYAEKDGEFLYLMVEFYGEANSTNYLDLYFNTKPMRGKIYFNTKLIHGNFQFGVDGFASWAKHFGEAGIRVGYAKVAEIAFPLKLFQNFAAIYVEPMVYIPSINKWDDCTERMVMIWVDKDKGLNLSYEVIVHDKTRLIEVYAYVKNLKYYEDKEVRFKFNSHWIYPTYQCYLVNISFTIDEQTLSYRLIDKDLWNIELPPNTDELCVHYFLNITIIPAHSNFFGDDYIVAYVGSLFIYPDVTTICKIRFKFDLPSQWSIATQWDEENGEFITENLEYIKRGFIAIGKYEIQKFQINNITLIVSIHNMTKLALNDLVNYSKNCFSHLIGFLNYPFSDAKNFLVIFAPPPSMCGTADFCGPSCTINSMEERFGLWVLPHEMFHILDGFWGGALEEGITQYYGYKTSLYSGLWSFDDFYRCLTIYEPYGISFYYTEIWNSKYNLPIVSEELDYKLKEKADDWHYCYIRAMKMAIISYMLDKEIKIRTKGSKTLDDVISYLNHKYSDPRHNLSPEELLQTINLITRDDFTEFFTKDIYGNDWLPPVPIRDWFDWYINKVENLLMGISLPNKKILEEIKVLKAECDNVIDLIYKEKYQEALNKTEIIINNFKNLLRSIVISKKESSISISLSSSEILTGEEVIIGGRISLPIAGASVTISYRPMNGSWSTIATVSTDSDGKYLYSWSDTPHSVGSYEVMASWQGNSEYEGASNIVKLDVVSVPFSFNLTIRPNSIILPKVEGNSSTVEVIIASNYNYPIIVSLDVIGLPCGVKAVFEKNNLIIDRMSTGSTLLTLILGKPLPDKGEYAVTITGVCYNVTAKATASIIIEEEIEKLNINIWLFLAALIFVIMISAISILKIKS